MTPAQKTTGSQRLSRVAAKGAQPSGPTSNACRHLGGCKASPGGVLGRPCICSKHGLPVFWPGSLFARQMLGSVTGPDRSPSAKLAP
jgi:hypothetical protein